MRRASTILRSAGTSSSTRARRWSGWARVGRARGGGRGGVDGGGLDDLAVGEHVVVYASQALERMDPEDVEMVLGFYAGLEAMLEEAGRGRCRPGPRRRAP